MTVFLTLSKFIFCQIPSPHIKSLEVKAKTRVHVIIIGLIKVIPPITPK